MVSSTVPSGHSPAGYPELEIPPHPVAFLYECAGSRCYATEQPKGGDTPYVQMLRIFHSNNYHVELITNCRAYDHGNPTGRPRAFVMAYLADPGEELLCPSDAKAIIDATP